MVKTAEELSDVIANFQLYYGTELGRVHDWEQQTARDNLELGYAPRFKLCGRTDKYQVTNILILRLQMLKCHIPIINNQFYILYDESE